MTLTPLQDGEDTLLARALHAAGVLSVDQLTPLLSHARVERERDPQASLARVLVQRGLIQEPELQHYRFAVDTVVQGLVQQPQRGPALRVGGQFAGYELEEVLGRGGMGVVFRARQTGTGRQVALKAVDLQDDPELAERFLREGAVMAEVDAHPNVARVFEAGQVERYGFLAVELLTGGDLYRKLRSGPPLTSREAAHVLSQLARGLAHVHARGILHRDLKPANVLFDADGTPKLLDFGLAQIQGAESLTHTGQLLGTPAYMPPEQAIGLKQLDVRTDVYGLGAILYSCLTGRPPFEGILTDVLARVMNDDPPPPRRLRPDVDPALEAICLRAMAKKPDARYPDADAFAEALDAWARDPEAAQDPPPKRGWLVWGVPALVVGAALGFGLARLGEAPTPPPPTPLNSGLEPDAKAVDPPPPARSPEPAPSKPPAETQVSLPEPRVHAPEELEVGSTLLVPAELKDGTSVLRLASVTATGARTDDGGRWVTLQRGEDPPGELKIPPTGAVGDPFGVGAQALAEEDNLERLVPCTVVERRGPVAMIEVGAGDRWWLPVWDLALAERTDGVDPGEDATAEVVIAPWPTNSRRYAAVVIDEDDAAGQLRLAYLDDETAWVPRDEVTPLPTRTDRVHYEDENEDADADEDEEYVPCTVLEVLPGWLVRLARRDTRAEVVVPLCQLRILREDRE